MNQSFAGAIEKRGLVSGSITILGSILGGTIPRERQASDRSRPGIITNDRRWRHIAQRGSAKRDTMTAVRPDRQPDHGSDRSSADPPITAPTSTESGGQDLDRRLGDRRIEDGANFPQTGLRHQPGEQQRVTIGGSLIGGTAPRISPYGGTAGQRQRGIYGFSQHRQHHDSSGSVIGRAARASGTIFA